MAKPHVYMIVENTPGYLPEDQDPETFDSYAEALRALIEMNSELMLDEDLDVDPIVNGRFTYERLDRTHDLGRVVEILPVGLESDS